MPYELPPEEFFPPHHRQGLFYSEAWQQAWLKAYGDHPDIQLHRESGVYTYRQWLKRLIPVRSATLIGATSPATRSIRAEYTCITETALQRSLHAPWDQLILPDVIEGSEDEQRVRQFADDNNFFCHLAQREASYAIDLNGGTFQSYLTKLGKNSRLRLYNRRSRLEQQGKVVVENLWPDQDRFYHLLNEFHLKRWNKPCYAGKQLTFMRELLSGLHQEGHKIELSVITLSKKPISVVLDITANGRCYNVQSGYLENLNKHISLGTLHFGFRIEEAYRSNAQFYDFMAGSGKNTQYKQALSTSSNNIVSLRVIRSPSLKAFYKLK